MILIETPYYEQNDEHNCVPISAMMLFEYYQYIHNHGIYHLKEVSSLFKTTKLGTYYRDAFKALRKLGYKIKKVNSYKEAKKHLRRRKPLMVSYKDNAHGYHTALIVGYDDKKGTYTLNDPYYGENLVLPKLMFHNVVHSMYLVEPK